MIVQLINGALTAALIGWLLLTFMGLCSMVDAHKTARRNERHALG
jgi:uncharacterized integral membrane protein